jgi:hypothetical protein
MIKRVNRWVRSAYERSPRDNFSRLVTKLSKLSSSGNGNGAVAVAPPAPVHANGNGKTKAASANGSEKKNDVLPTFLDEPVYKKFLPARLRNSSQNIIVLGSSAEISFVVPAFLGKCASNVVGLVWDWDGEVNLDALPVDAPIVVCKVPTCDREWWVIRRLKVRYGSRVVGIQELVLPFATLEMARTMLPFHEHDLNKLADLYTGQTYFGPLAELDRVFPLKGKRIIEFGPMDGYQTAGLVKLGASHVTCIEARPENLMKTLIASQVFGWDNVRLVMDDFHNADHWKYGKYDLAFAHGVYYHSLAPFLFLENMLALAPNVFIGGFCATDHLPGGNYETLMFDGFGYRAKPYRENLGFFTAGVNPYGYYFHGDDLMEFYRRRGCQVTLISDEVMPTAAGRYLRFLASRQE